jgi:uncharacterized protein (TIGR03083 family)
MSPQEKVANFVTASGALVAELESMTDADLDAKKLNLGFLPMPVDIGFFAGMRLTELALHGWDVDVALDRTAQVDEALVPFVLDRLPGYASFLAKPGDTSGVVSLTVTDPSRAFTLRLAKDATGLDEGLSADATTRVSMPAEAFARLLAGRLAAEHTPASVMVDGSLSLDDLRSIFPGM